MHALVLHKQEQEQGQTAQRKRDDWMMVQEREGDRVRWALCISASQGSGESMEGEERPVISLLMYKRNCGDSLFRSCAAASAPDPTECMLTLR